MNGEEICTRYDGLKSLRSNWESHWQEIAEVIAPRFSDMVGSRTDGDKRMARVFDSTGIQMNGLLAAGLHGIATNPASRWFGLRVLNEQIAKQDSVREYISDTETLMFQEMHSPVASISSHLHEVYLDAGAFGYGAMFIGERNGRPMFQARHLKELYLDADPHGEVDTVYRCFKMTARQLWQRSTGEFGPAWVMPKDAAEAMASDKPNLQFDIIHGVFPRMDRDRKKKTRDNLPYASVYVFAKDKTILDESGFDEFPYAIFEWSKVPGEIYGRGPGMTALPDVKMLQRMMKTHIRAAEKTVDPPALLDDDAVTGPLRTMPGGVIYKRPGSDVGYLQHQGRLDISDAMMQDVRSRIGLTFHADIVRPFTERSNETATEVMQRVQQQMRLLGPVLGRLTRFLGQITTRVHGIMARSGRLGEPPEELENESFTVEFISPIATAQRSGEVEAVAQWLAINSQALQVDPTVADRIAWEKLPDWTADRMRIDPELVRSEDEAKEIAEAKAQQQQMQQAIAAAQPVAAAAKDGASALQTLRGAA